MARLRNRVGMEAIHMEISPEQRHDIERCIAAIITFAHEMADLAGRYLRAAYPEGGVKLTAGQLLRLAAELRVEQWIRAGSDVADLVAASETDSDYDFSERVFRAWFERWAWEAPAELGVDIRVSQVNPGRLVDELAEFLWRNRHLARGSTHE